MYPSYTSHQFAGPQTVRNSDISRFAVRLYNRVIWMGKMNNWSHRLFGRNTELKDLNQAASQTTIVDRNYLGQSSVPVDKIIGSESRSGDFDEKFYPLQENTRDRWVRIASARQQNIGLPPVELIKLGDLYFVRDGHHRISVARAIGEVYIDAIVTEWKPAF